jgi:methyltransferase
MPENVTLDPTAIAVLAFVAVQRLAELAYARRNEARLRALGAIEFSRDHYWAIVTLHGIWLAGLLLIAPGEPPNLLWLLIFVALQALRFWVLATLGERWTTRIIVLPGAPLMRDGPYRFMRHPNYAIVVAEIFVLPMVFGLYAYALVFSLLNAGILAVRIQAEDRALQRASSPR